MEKIQLTKEELKEIQQLNEDKNRLTFDFGRVKTDMILLKSQLDKLEKMEEDMVAKFKGNETKAKKVMDKLNKTYGDGSVNVNDGTFTPTPKKDGEEER
tara:strand:+ start:929 stop:1225 length:297 start_codon:yes stop_codon:yes gene_type:complete